MSAKPIERLDWPGYGPAPSVTDEKIRKAITQPLTLFPDPSTATSDGILGYSYTMSSAMLYAAYSVGIFPWPSSDNPNPHSVEEVPILWFCPHERGILNFADLHVSQSLKKFMKKNSFRVTLNENFSEVILACSKVVRQGQGGTWITPSLIETYQQFHQLGFAHSVEVWENEELVGGLYGVFVKNIFSGESMFHRKDNASKVALLFLIRKLQEIGLQWMDIQMVTPVTKSFGGQLVTQSEYLQMLKQAQR
jgi:leucyl/phenylalanyl-tRNA--protein transferase